MRNSSLSAVIKYSFFAELMFWVETLSYVIKFKTSTTGDIVGSVAGIDFISVFIQLYSTEKREKLFVVTKVQLRI